MRGMGTFAGEYLLGGRNLTRCDFEDSKLKATFCKYWTPIKTKISENQNLSLVYTKSMKLKWKRHRRNEYSQKWSFYYVITRKLLLYWGRMSFWWGSSNRWNFFWWEKGRRSKFFASGVDSPLVPHKGKPELHAPLFHVTNRIS